MHVFLEGICMKRFFSLFLVFALGIVSMPKIQAPPKEKAPLEFWSSLEEALNKHEEIPETPCDENQAEIKKLIRILWPHKETSDIYNLASTAVGIFNTKRFIHHAFMFGFAQGITDTKNRNLNYKSLSAADQMLKSNKELLCLNVTNAEKLYRETISLATTNYVALALASFAIGFLEGSVYQVVLKKPSIVMLGIGPKIQEKFLAAHKDFAEATHRELLPEELQQKESFIFPQKLSPETDPIIDLIALAYINGMKNAFDVNDIEAFIKKCTEIPFDQAYKARINIAQRITTLRQNEGLTRRALASACGATTATAGGASAGAGDAREPLAPTLSLKEELVFLIHRLITKTPPVERTATRTFQEGFEYGRTLEKTPEELVVFKATIKDIYVIIITKQALARDSEYATNKLYLIAIDGILEGLWCAENRRLTFALDTETPATSTLDEAEAAYVSSGIAGDAATPIDVNAVAALRKYITKCAIGTIQQYSKISPHISTQSFMEKLRTQKRHKEEQERLAAQKIIDDLKAKEAAEQAFKVAQEAAEKMGEELAAEEAKKTLPKAPSVKKTTQKKPAAASTQSARKESKEEQKAREAKEAAKKVKEDRRLQQQANIQAKEARRLQQQAEETARLAEEKAQRDAAKKAAQEAKKKTKKSAGVGAPTSSSTPHSTMPPSVSASPMSSTDASSWGSGASGSSSPTEKRASLKPMINPFAKTCGEECYQTAFDQGSTFYYDNSNDLLAQNNLQIGTEKALNKFARLARLEEPLNHEELSRVPEEIIPHLAFNMGLLDGFKAAKQQPTS